MNDTSGPNIGAPVDMAAKYGRPALMSTQNFRDLLAARTHNFMQIFIRQSEEARHSLCEIESVDQNSKSNA